MKKVGIVSCYFKHNYGSMLQAYATQRVLNNMGIENETINVEKNENSEKTYNELNFAIYKDAAKNDKRTAMQFYFSLLRGFLIGGY